MTQTALYRLNVRCPYCRSAPRMRGTELSMSRFRDDPPDQVVLTYQCAAKLRDQVVCGQTYEIQVKHFQKV